MKREDHNPLDKLFREQLRDHSVKPSPEAWERIAQEKPAGRNNRGLFLKVASVALLLGLGGVLFWQQPELFKAQQQMPQGATVNPQKSFYGPSQTGLTASESVSPFALDKLTSDPENSQARNSKTSKTSAPALPVVDEEALAAHQEEDRLAFKGWKSSIVEDKTPALQIAIKLYEEKSEETAAPAITPLQDMPSLKKNLVSYAEDQWQRLLAGKELKLPEKQKPETLHIPFP